MTEYAPLEQDAGPGRENPRAGRRLRAFTILELLAVVVIIGVLSAMAVPRYQDFVEKAKVARAIGDIRTLSTDIDSQDSLPASLAAIGRGNLLDPWGNAYVYYPFPPTNGNAPPAGARRDRFIVPVNSTYDLYSMGPDGQSQIPFTAQASRDDIVRASDGGYIGPAANY